MNGKQKAYLRKLSNNIQSIFQVGKGGVNENLIKQIDDALEARELIKISILENSLMDNKEAANQFAKATNSEIVQVIGNKVILYRESKEKPSIILPE